MKSLIALTVLLALASGCGQNTNTTLESSVKKSAIVGGNEVDPSVTDTSFIVSIGNGCAGSIIADKWILTAAHCRSLFRRPVSGGNVDVYANDRVLLKVKDSYEHPGYVAYKSTNDFALLELKEKIDFKATGLSAITIAHAEFEKEGHLNPGTMVTAYGWGLMSENGSAARFMREVNLPIVDREVANATKAYNGKINESMLAAGYAEGKKDSCQGDSGGPLVLQEGPTGERVLVGVVSWGDGCARMNKYGIYSNIAVAAGWIQRVMANNP